VRLAKYIEEAVTNADLKLAYFIHLASDGPNVSKTVFNIINSKMFEIRKNQLVFIGTYNFHIVHNALIKGIEKSFGIGIDPFIIALKYFFKYFPNSARDFEGIQEKLLKPKHVFIKNGKTRRQTLGVEEQLEIIREYFLEYIPENQPHLMKKVHYVTIKNFIQIPQLLSELSFIKSAAYLFTMFTKKYQTSAPLIHELETDLKNFNLVSQELIIFGTKSIMKLIQI
jgi:hypothetical protein